VSNSEEHESTVEGTIKAVSELVDKVPVYDDAVQPLARETGKALGTVGKAVNAALMPIRGLVWGMEQIEGFVKSKVSQKLKNVPPENIQTPDPSVAGPAIESLRFTGHKESLAEMYANLLATSMDKGTAKTAHPGFVEIIRNLSGDEAKILSHMAAIEVLPIVDIRREQADGNGGVTVSQFVTTVGHDAGCEHRELSASYLKNLERLGLIDVHRDMHLTSEGIYDRILNDPPIKKIESDLNSIDGHKAEFKKYYADLSQLGLLFINACVASKEA